MLVNILQRIGYALLLWIGAGVAVSLALALVPDAGAASFGQRLGTNLTTFFTFDYAGRRSENFPLSVVLLNRSLLSFTLIGGALLMALGLGVSAGVPAALKPRNRLVGLWTGFLNTLSAMPVLVFGILTILLVTRLGGTPPFRLALETAGGGGILVIYLLPMLTLAVGDNLLADIARTLRTETTRLLDQDYIRAARARNVGLHRHLIRTLTPVTISALAGKTAYLIGGSVVVEYVFGWPGLGFQVLEILTTDGPKDYPFILAATTLFVGLTVLLNLASDLAVLASDPRLRAAPSPAPA